MRKLADEIIQAQRKEIAEMKYLIRSLERDGIQAGHKTSSLAEQMPAGEAARTADVAKVDLEPITNAELQHLLGFGSVCQFAYEPDDVFVAAATAPGAAPSRGLIKLHGRLVQMAVRYPASPSQGFELSSDDVTVMASSYAETATSQVREAEARLHVGTDFDVGYVGFYSCTR